MRTTPIETDTGVVMMHGRPVIIQKLRKEYHHDGYKYVVIELNTIAEKRAWLWDGVADV
tara:strand:+ start:8146 stop:8322 length:177 start_codon:yes stop_codon:yes gene_type:complete